METLIAVGIIFLVVTIAIGHRKRSFEPPAAPSGTLQTGQNGPGPGEVRNRDGFNVNIKSPGKPTVMSEQQANAWKVQIHIEKSCTAFSQLQNDFRSAERALDVAEAEFSGGFFAPFWDAVEQAATSLVNFDSNVRKIATHSHGYQVDIKKLDSAPPFPLEAGAFPDIAATVTRMYRIVRLAQKEPVFAQIYEQRKTNKLLLEGFSSLGQALNEMGSRIASSIDGLSYSISELRADNHKNSHALISSIENSAESLRRQMESDAAASRQHERKERGVLDNIQRDRKPLI